MMRMMGDERQRQRRGLTSECAVFVYESECVPSVSSLRVCVSVSEGGVRVTHTFTACCQPLLLLP